LSGSDANPKTVSAAVRTDETLTLANDVVTVAANDRVALELAALQADAQARSQNILGLNIHGSYVPTGNSPASLAANSPLWRDLDEMQDQAKSEHKTHVIAGAASLVSVGMSVVYFMWAVRAGSVLSSLLSSMPAWKLVDPLPILDQMAGGFDGRKRDDDEDDETLESMVDNQAAPA
jgi:hypothetical protein